MPGGGGGLRARRRLIHDRISAFNTHFFICNVTNISNEFSIDSHHTFGHVQHVLANKRRLPEDG